MCTKKIADHAGRVKGAALQPNPTPNNDAAVVEIRHADGCSDCGTDEPMCDG